MGETRAETGLPVAAPPARASPFPLWDALFDALPWPPPAVGALVAFVFFALFVSIDLWAGNYTPERLGGRPWWVYVEFRNAVAVSLLVAGLVTTHCMERAGARRDLTRLRPHLAESADEWARIEREVTAVDRRRLRAYGVVGGLGVVAILPFLYLDPTRFLHARTYFDPAVLFDAAVAWIIGSVTAKQLYLSISQDGAFAQLAYRLPQVDLLDLSPLRPFAQRGLRRSARWIVLAALASFAFFDAGLFEVPALALLGIMAFALVNFVLPLRKARQRVREEKRRQLDALAREIRRERDRLGENDGARANGRLADLCALDARLREVPEWPVATPIAFQLSVYLAIPVLSWLGGAFVERLVSAALDR